MTNCVSTLADSQPFLWLLPDGRCRVPRSSAGSGSPERDSNGLHAKALRNVMSSLDCRSQLAQRRGSGAVCANPPPLFVIPSQLYRRGICFSAGSETTDSLRLRSGQVLSHSAALRSDNSSEIFNLHRQPRCPCLGGTSPAVYDGPRLGISRNAIQVAAVAPVLPTLGRGLRSRTPNILHDRPTARTSH